MRNGPGRNHCMGARVEISKGYMPNSFDRVLLDAPCSALGLRPRLFAGEVNILALLHLFCCLPSGCSYLEFFFCAMLYVTCKTDYLLVHVPFQLMFWEVVFAPFYLIFQNTKKKRFYIHYIFLSEFTLLTLLINNILNYSTFFNKG